jgi:quinol monooxygenase YgiN
MKFAQIIEFHTDRVDEVRALVQDYENHARGEDRADRPRHRMLLQDRDNSGHYLALVEFDSPEAAAANSNRPETSALAQKMATLTTEPPTFTNCDLLESKDL